MRQINGDAPPDRAVWLLMRRDLARVPRVRLVADAIAALFAAQRGRLEGAAPG